MFDGLTLEQLGVSDWNKQEVANELLLFHKDIYAPEDECDGFEFCCVYQVCETVSGDDAGRIGYEVIFEGTALFDGVRHLYFGKEETQNYGYLYYQDLPMLISALKALDDLQVSKCAYVRNDREVEDETSN